MLQSSSNPGKPTGKLYKWSFLQLFLVFPLTPASDHPFLYCPLIRSDFIAKPGCVALALCLRLHGHRRDGSHIDNGHSSAIPRV